ncbi:fimbrillin family protein [Prevotella sp. F0091]|uniref:fimbrillin family protein n=1 Tax=Prevotella sp. F0091 TaxID=1227276 RepID=UPI0025FE6758|nr:fimbrillin family protein [Prevotella sp. F0091]
MNIKLSYHWAIAAFLTVFAGCSSDDITTGTVTKPDADKTETNQVSFVAGNQGTRTSLNYDNGDFYWEAGDQIFVKDDENNFNKSSNAVTGTNVSHFKFMMPGKYTQNSYVVCYPGKNGTNDNVTIATEQTQNDPDNTTHFGTSGDCGTGTATLKNGQYEFKLKHSAAYLCFKPSYDHPLTNTYVTKIEVTADKDIAGNYTLGSDGKLTAKGGGSKTITLTPKSAGSSDGFKMKNSLSKTGCETGRMFMVIAPGTYKLTVKYYLTDTHTNVSGVITKKFGSFKYGANDYYDIVSNLDIYAAGKYYMWDAKQDYWYQYEGSQPKVADTPGSNYPTKSDALRWHNKAKFPTAASNSAKSCPNINELYWYCLNGAPHWDDTTLWAAWGHLYTGGMWFKKASVIASENGKVDAAALKTVSPDGKNRAGTQYWETPKHNNDVKQGIPNNRKNYFFLPATGRYANGELKDFRTTGCYWTSTPEPYFEKRAYNLFFDSGKVTISNSNDRTNGFRLWTSE